MLVVLICVVMGANAGNRYQVTVRTQINYVYYDEKGNEVGRESTVGVAQVFDICADTPDEARRNAESECSTMCTRSFNKNEGKKLYRGQYYQCYSTREVYDSSYVSLNQSC